MVPKPKTAELDPTRAAWDVSIGLLLLWNPFFLKLGGNFVLTEEKRWCERGDTVVVKAVATLSAEATATTINIIITRIIGGRRFDSLYPSHAKNGKWQMTVTRAILLAAHWSRGKQLVLMCYCGVMDGLLSAMEAIVVSTFNVSRKLGIDCDVRSSAYWRYRVSSDLPLNLNFFPPLPNPAIP